MAGEVFPDFQGIAQQDPEAARALSRPLMAGGYKAACHEPGDDRSFPPEPSVVMAAVTTYLSPQGVQSKGWALVEPNRWFERRLVVDWFVQQYRQLVGKYQELGRPLVESAPTFRIGQFAVELARRSGEPVVGSCYMMRGVPSGKLHTALMIPRETYDQAPPALREWLRDFRDGVQEEFRASAGMRDIEMAVQLLAKTEQGDNLGLGFVSASIHMPQADTIRDMLALHRS